MTDSCPPATPSSWGEATRGTEPAAASSSSAFQFDLFGDSPEQGHDDPVVIAAPTIDSGFTTTRHIELDATSWIEHVPGWLRPSVGLFDELMASAPWEQRSRYMWSKRVIEPRLTAEYQDLADVPQRALRLVTDALSHHYQVDYRYLWLNLYRTHRDSTSWHGDPIGKLQQTSIVPVLSLGATRRFLIKSRDGGKSEQLTVSSGDLIVMGGRSQRDWLHSVPKQSAPAGPRISVNFAPRHYPAYPSKTVSVR
jgi:alkylated DNA repair dioxygenase AlkB